MERLWQHEETGRFVWHENPGRRWYAVQMIHEDELPAGMTQDEYDAWYENSHVPDGVGCRMGPKLAPNALAERTGAAGDRSGRAPGSAAG